MVSVCLYTKHWTMWMVSRLDEPIHRHPLVFTSFSPFFLSYFLSSFFSFFLSFFRPFVLSSKLESFTGMLFDHSCDAVNTCVMIAPISSILGIGWCKGFVFGAAAGDTNLLCAFLTTDFCFINFYSSYKDFYHFIFKLGKSTSWR